MKVWKNLVVFYIGGMLYAALELLWRGWTHGSMFVVGGLCFSALNALHRAEPALPVAVQMAVGAVLITVVEFFSGLLLNRMMMLHIWDYSAAPYNLFGQICLPFSLLWFPVSGAAILAGDALRHGLFHEQTPRYRWL